MYDTRLYVDTAQNLHSGLLTFITVDISETCAIITQDLPSKNGLVSSECRRRTGSCRSKKGGQGSSGPGSPRQSAKGIKKPTGQVCSCH